MGIPRGPSRSIGRCWKSGRKVLGEEHPDTARASTAWLALYKSKAEYAKAEPLYRQGPLEINKKAFGERHPSTAASLNNLALLYDSMGDLAKAEPLYRQVLEIRGKVLGENHPRTGTSLNNLALLYKSMGDYAKAEPLYRGPGDRTKVLGNKHPRHRTEPQQPGFAVRLDGGLREGRAALRTRWKSTGKSWETSTRTRPTASTAWLTCTPQ